MLGCAHVDSKLLLLLKVIKSHLTSTALPEKEGTG